MGESRRWPLVPRSLTGRLVAGVVVLVLLIVAGVGIATYVSLRASLYGRLNEQLQSTAGSRQAIVDLFSSTPGTTAPGVTSPQQVWVVALYEDGRVLFYADSRQIERLYLAQDDRMALANRQSTASVHVETEDGQDLLVTVQQLTLEVQPTVSNPSGRIAAAVVVGLSTSEVEHTLDRLLEIEVLIGVAALVIAAAATAYGVRFGLRHLHRVTHTAQEVAAELSPEGAGLDRRVPVDDPGTEVGTLAESMNALLAAVETQFTARVVSEQRMRQFLADASHELRTPLTSIRGYAELARMQRALGATEEDNLARIESEGTRMSRLVDDLLTLARGDRGVPPEPVPVDVAELIDDVVAGAKASFPQRSIEFDAPDGLVLVGDHDQLLRVVRNLVTNAATYTRPDGPIMVCAQREDWTSTDGVSVVPGVRITVHDAGPGLPPDEAAHVFERFWRADKARSRARGGSGLGLSIVASIVQAHGGSVRFDSTVESGSTATVWLPVTQRRGGAVSSDGVAH